ncbi:MAG TPA: PilZ domain-containing protein, partial [Polyangia bacterium]
IRAPISVVVELGDARAEARDISGDGIFVVTDVRLPIGARTVVRVADEPPTGDDIDAEAPYDQWEFAAEVVRLDVDGMGLRFVGIPLVLRITHRSQSEAAPLRMHAA